MDIIRNVYQVTNMNYNLGRFITAQLRDNKQAYKEIKNGKKITHWMWYIFPQLKGLGSSEYAEYYGIESIEEAWEITIDACLNFIDENKDKNITIFFDVLSEETYKKEMKLSRKIKTFNETGFACFY